MNAVNFKESNFTFLKPKDTELDVQPLPVYRGKDSAEHDVVVSCWQLDEEELKQITQTGKIWLWVYFRVPPPVGLSVESPFLETKQP